LAQLRVCDRQLAPETPQALRFPCIGRGRRAHLEPLIDFGVDPADEEARHPCVTTGVARFPGFISRAATDLVAILTESLTLKQAA